MRIGVAQIRPKKGDPLVNLNKHLDVIRKVSSWGANAIFFPELSLIGYEPTLAKSLAIAPNDSCLDALQKESTLHHITIGVGMPTLGETGIKISLIIFQPHRSRIIYSKQRLHPDEFPFFVEGNQQVILPLDQTKLAPAICYESLQPAHALYANELGATMYVASVAKSAAGVAKALAYFPEVARKYAMPVLMSNCVGECDNFESAGLSSVWSSSGDLVGQLDGKSEGLLVFDTKHEKVIAKPL